MAVLSSLLVIEMTAQPKPPAAEALLGRALHQEEVEANLEAAVATYKQVIARHGSNRAVAAKAQFRIGACYEKMGDSEARKAYERVLSSYADQRSVAAEARSRLAAMAPPRARGPRSLSVRQVWSGPETDTTGTVSPDGRYLSYVHWETGDLALHDLVSGENRVVTNKGTWAQSRAFADMNAMSPDSRQIAYCWDNGKPDPVWAGELRVIGINGGQPRTVYAVPGDYVRPRAWSPDGRLIVMALQHKDNTNEIAVVPAAGGAARVLKVLDKGPQYRGELIFSHDGRYVLYDHRGDIFVIPAGGGAAETPLVQHQAADSLLGVTPDGTGALFTSNRSGSMGIWLIRIAEGKPQGEPELVKPDAGPIVPLGSTANGALYYGLRLQPRDVYQAALDIPAGKVVAAPRMLSHRSQGSISGPDWAADGRLAFKSDRTLSIRAAGTEELREIVPQLRGFGAPRWRPDGQSILVPGNKDGRRGLYSIDPRSGDASLLLDAEPDAPVLDALWSPDGKAVFFQTQSGVYRQVLDGGTKQLIARPRSDGVLRSFTISPDGRQVAYVYSNTMVVASSAGGEPRELLRLTTVDEQFQFNGGLAWSTDGNFLLFAKTPRFPLFELWRIPAAGGVPQKLDIAMDHLQQLRIHPDGKQIAFSAGPRKVEIWVLENFLK